MTQPTRIGLIGAGYIATWHADAIRATKGATLAAICDVSANAAEALATGYGVKAFTDVAELIQSGEVDAVHILTPPHLHEPLAIECLQGGLDVLVEKPVAESAEGTRRIQAAAEAAGKSFRAGHNFLGLPSYARLKTMVQSGDLGRIASADVTWALPLAPLRSGPYNLWLLREPKNLLLELGPHLMGFVVDLFGAPEILFAEATRPVDLPGNDPRPQGFRILARAGGVDINITVSMVETIDDRSVTLRGSSARARLDYASDTLVIERENASDLVVNPLRKQLGLSWQHLREGGKNAGIQLTSLNTKNPYAQSFRGMNKAVYGDGDAERFSGPTAVTVMQALDDAIGLIPAEQMATTPPARRSRKPKPTVMVIGGTGFIGRALTRRLVADGKHVRVLSRGKTGPFPDLPNKVETISASLHDETALTEAMDGIDVVFNLAKSLDKTWEDCLKNDVGVTENIARACQAAGVRRLIYTGTIASYDMSDPGQTITESTGFGEDMTDRNLYARSKAECERSLLQMYAADGLPVVIARPGIVVGHGGPLQHWGIGRWHGAGAVRIWGNGRNILPFVLIDDVADGLVRMMDGDILGESYNLIGEPMLSGRDYFDAIHDALGARIRVSTGNLHAFYAADAVKYVLKKHALRRHGVIRPSLADWKSRAHLSPFDNAKPKAGLGWTPETDRQRFVEAAITNANLLGW